MGGESIVVRRSEHGWQVGDEQAADLTSAMVLADLRAAELGPAGPPAGPWPAFDLLRSAARGRRQAGFGVAEDVVDSASDPLRPLAPAGHSR